MRRVEDFILQFGSIDGGKARIRVVSSPAGEGGATVLLPNELVRLSRSPQRDQGIYRHLSPESEHAEFSHSPERLGRLLFESLFVGEIRQLFDRSLGSVSAKGSLRIQLKFALEACPSQADSFQLPWELLFRPDTRDFLALSRTTPLVRYLDVPRPTTPFLPGLPLRVLVVISAPRGLASLNSAAEIRAIRSAWGRRTDAEATVLYRSNLEALRREILRAPVHIVHYMGHASMAGEEGQLFLTGPDGEQNALCGQALSMILKDCPSLRLVVLNACETARADGCDPFAGLASSLVIGGSPAVVAMQSPIPDQASVDFSRTFHERLAAGDPLECAVTEGRRAIYSSDPNGWHWATPVLFSRVSQTVRFPLAASVANSDKSPGRVRRAPTQAPPLKRSAALASSLLIAASLAVSWGLPETPAESAHWPVKVPQSPRAAVGNLFFGVHEVTNGEFLQFANANSRWRKGRVFEAEQDGDYLKHWKTWKDFNPALKNHPVTHVSWFAAQAFCSWAGGRLPLRHEWSKAAHSADFRFPWGKDFEREAGPPLNFCDRSCDRDWADTAFQDGHPETAAVGSFLAGRTSEGLDDLGGNVWEWCADASGSQRATMGGSYLSTFEECSSHREVWENGRLCAPDGGFRCVWEQ